MQPDDKLLRIISNETKSAIESLSIVTPTIFSSVFSQLVQAHHANIENEEELALDLIAQECTNLREMQTQASKSAQMLSNNTSKALNAMKEKDETLLNEVLVETEKLRQEVEQLKESLYKDELTNSYNRKWLHDNYVDEETQELTLNGTLVMIDLNYFKIVNDTYGHIIGDKVLLHLANNFRKTSHPVIRYGGDEFLVLMPHMTSESAAIKIMNTLREKIIAKKLKTHESIFRVSFSFGATSFKKGDNLADIIEETDKKMYKDKIAIKERITGI